MSRLLGVSASSLLAGLLRVVTSPVRVFVTLLKVLVAPSATICARSGVAARRSASQIRTGATFVLR
jgi:hypothetical protein